ncbi:hypothetical protein ACFTSF_09065 [Kribbella sp. NPDC056951]|uniref:hypothetical protein n=1 Tax=Kribbella sp. NPDC056951 TaxID=3345978 RepID=UPI003640008B
MFIGSLFKLWSLSSLRFGLEGVGSPTEEEDESLYVHQAITGDAFRNLAVEPGGQWNADAARVIKWHVDYVDSYLYNPLFWVGGVFSDKSIRRIKAAASMHDDLVQVHFDDLTSVGQIEKMWHRYLSGSVAGVLWAADRGDVEAAQNIIGVTLHAIQDFYAHSNWVDDPSRRMKHYFHPGIDADVRRSMYLYSGSYEVDEHHSQKPHGKVSFECAIIEAVNVADVMSIACSAISPLNKMTPCQIYDRCKNAEPVSIEVLGIPLPKGMVYVNPPGIALDSTWQAKIAHQIRELPDRTAVTPEALFGAARQLAVDSSVWWLRELGNLMAADPVTKAFWDRVKQTSDAYERRHEQFEDFARFPYTFVSAGNYPPTAADEPWDWYVRLLIKTSDDGEAGTDGTVHVRFGDKEFPLDYMKTSPAILEYNDFESGDLATYTIGPLKELPREVTFRVESKDIGDIAEVIWDGFIGALESLIDSIGDFLLSIFGGHADLVGSRQLVWNAADLENIGYEPVAFSQFIDGDDEGQHHIHGHIRRTDEASGPGVPYEWREFEVYLDRLECWEESTWDRGSDEDEPFVLALLINLSDDQPETRTQKWRCEPGSVDDRGDKVWLRHTFNRIRVPKGAGGIALPLTVFESDDETSDARDELLDAYAGKGDGDTQSWSDRFIETVGASLWSGWKMESVELQAFNRAPARAASATVLRSRPDRWVTDDGPVTLALDPNPVWRRWSLPMEIIRSRAIADSLVERSQKLAASDNAESVACAEEAVVISRAIVAADQAKTEKLTRLVWTIHFLSSRYHGTGRAADSAGLGDEAIGVSERAVDASGTDPGVQTGVAVDLAHISGYVAPGDEAVRTAEYAVELLREVADDDHSVHAHQARLVWGLHVLSGRLHSAGRAAEAAGLGDEGIKVARRLATATPDLRSDAAYNLAHVSGYVPAGAEAVRAAQHALATYRELSAADPADNLSAQRLMWVLHVVSSRLYTAKRQAESAGLGDEGIAVLPRLATAPPEVRADAAYNLAHVSGYVPPGDEAVRAAQQALAVYRELSAADPANHLSAQRLVWVLHVVSSRLYTVNRQAESAGLGDEGIAVLPRLAGAPAATRSDAAYNLGHVSGYVPPGDEAVRAAQHSLAVYRELSAADPASSLEAQRLVWALHGLCSRLFNAARQAETAGLGDEGIAVLPRLAAAPPEVRSDAAYNLAHVAGYLVAGEEGVRAAQGTVGVYRELYAAAPTNSGYRSRLAWSLRKLAERLRSAGHQTEAQAADDEAKTLEG